MSEYQMPPPNKVNSPQPGNGDEETIDLLELFMRCWESGGRSQQRLWPAP